MFNVIVKTFAIHKKKFILNIIQFSIAFMSLMLSICMIEQVMEYKKNVKSVMNLDTVQMYKAEDDDVEIEAKNTQEVTLSQQYGNAYNNVKKKYKNNLIGIMDSISVYDEDSEIENTIMVNKDFMIIKKWVLNEGSIEELLKFDNINDNVYIPVIVSDSLKIKYQYNKEYKIEYVANDNIRNVCIKVVGVDSKDSYMFMGNATYISETISNKKDYMIFPKITEFSDFAYEYNVLIENNKNIENLKHSIGKQYAEINQNVEFITLENQIKKYYNSQRVVIIATMGFAFILIVLSLLGTIGTLLSSITIRKREFGIYYSMGLAKKNLIYMILGEGLIIFIVSFIISIIFSQIIICLMNEEVFKISIWNIGVTLLIMLICIIICEWLPTSKISRYEPIDLINEEMR